MFVYILQSLINGKHYYGSTKDVEKRIKLHNRGKVRSTKANRPYKLIYSEKFKTRSEAVKREYFFKSIDGYKWLKVNSIIN